jgi:hypothetical protein
MGWCVDASFRKADVGALSRLTLISPCSTIDQAMRLADAQAIKSPPAQRGKSFHLQTVLLSQGSARLCAHHWRHHA